MRYLLIIITLIFAINIAKAQLSGQAKIDSLLKELPMMKEDTNGVNLLEQLTFLLYSSDPDKGIEIGLMSIELAKKIDWKLGEANSYNSLAVVYSGGKSNFPKALEYFLKSLEIYKEIKSKNGIASAYSNIGGIYEFQSDFPKALNYYHKALKIYEVTKKFSHIASLYGNIGNLFVKLNEYPKAIDYYKKALDINEEINNQEGIANYLINIGIVYKQQLDYPKALDYHLRSLVLMEKLGKKTLVALVLTNIGYINMLQSNYYESLEYFDKALKINQELDNKSGLATLYGNMGQLYLLLSKDSVLSNISEANTFVSLNKEVNLNRSIDFNLRSIKILEELGVLDSRAHYYKNLAEAYKLNGDANKAYDYLQIHIKLKDSVYNQENNERIATLEKLREDDVNRLKIEKQEILLKAKEDEKQLILMSAGGALLSVILILLIIVNQRRKSEKLLLNILPSLIAKRLKAKEENIADDFESATIIFIDLVGFTSFAKDKKASEVVELLNNIFHRFDNLVKKHGLEKIKTMGDGYLAVSGVPDIDSNNCKKAINFAFEVRIEIEKFNVETGLTINARIGLETGPLVAGVIGSSKFIYDIWGDSVNTASRMESTGLPGKIQITENVKTELEKQSLDFSFEEREAFEVKGKGLMQTYFLEN